MMDSPWVLRPMVRTQNTCRPISADSWLVRLLGVLLTLFVQCMHALTQNPRGGKILWHYVVYVFVMFALGNIGYFTHLRFIQLAFVDDREYPGGPLGYQAAHYTSVINITGVVACVPSLILTVLDGF